MTDTKDNDTAVEQPKMQPEDYGRLHEIVATLEVQFENIGTHYPHLIGPALLAVATHMVEKIYHCSNSVEDANILLASANEVGLQSWVQYEEGRREANNKPQIVTLDS